MQQQLAIFIFVLTYAGVAAGRVPGLMLDRTGIAVLGAIGMVVCGLVSFEQAVKSIDIPTILLLYALMIVSAQLRLGGFYTAVAQRITSLLHRPPWFLFLLMVTSAFLSAILANDIICLAFTPVITLALLRANCNPTPFLIGLAIASNIGSAATLIGNPQNMLIGQVGRLDFGAFLLWSLPPTLLSLAMSYLLIFLIYRKRFSRNAIGHTSPAVERNWPAYNGWQSGKGLIATAILMILFFTPVPRELSAIAVAGILLCSRKMKSRHIMELVDWHLISLFCALFVVIQGITIPAVPAQVMEMLSRHGVELNNLYILSGLSAVLSNLVSNVPATLLLVRFMNPANPVEWYTLATSSTFAGNLLIIGRIANLIVVEQAKHYGVEITFREHAAVGIPATISSLLILFGWIAL